MSLQSISADWRPSLNGSADVAIRQNGLRQQNRPAGVTKSFCEEWVYASARSRRQIPHSRLAEICQVPPETPPLRSTDVSQPSGNNSDGALSPLPERLRVCFRLVRSLSNRRTSSCTC